MSTSKIFNTLIDDKSAIFQTIEFHADRIIFRARLRQNMKQCPCCKSFNVRIKETKERVFRMMNLGQKSTHLKIDTHKLWCQKCGKKAWMELPFTCGKLPMTSSFVHYIIQLTAMTTLLCVALFLGLQWKTVKNIDKAHLSKRAKQFSFPKLRYISIDEIAIKKGHKYMTVFIDIATGQIIHAVEGRSEEALRPFLKLLSKKAKRLRGIGIDMSAAYLSAPFQV
ncbi:MAG TPA: transposase [Chitinophagaceae bacterium]|nr:transposase [Chitinophagaceae bacterium]